MSFAISGQCRQPFLFILRHCACELTFKFSASPNVSGATVAGITGVSKLGWEYLWILRKDVPDTVAYWGLIPTPLAVVVNQMYPYVPFAGLGIG